MNYKYDSEGNPYSISTYPQNITNLGKVEDLDDNFSELFWKMISDEIFETINLGCESDEIAEPGSSYLVRIDEHIQHAYASLLSLIHGAFHYADLLPRETDYQAPVKVVVLLHSLTKKKDEDAETGFERSNGCFKMLSHQEVG